ncbi:MAG: methyltransferase domain-containing protein [Clostridia bacterium]|nr:methyltransferase domain-containing protein [Clostridia bacterium]
MTDWNAEQYSKFRQQRTLPARDLARAIPLKHARRIIDIGCGIGNSTAVLKDMYPAAQITGADLSDNMLASAREQHPELDFIRFDASTDFPSLTPGYDVVFSNACIQWVPNHPQLLRNMMSILRQGGVLAVQTPMNHEEPIHRIIDGLVRSSKWAHRFPTPRIFHNLTQEAYFDLLSDLAGDFTIWQTTYCHRMPSHQSIMEWYKGTGLRPYLSALSPQDAAAFESDVLQEVINAYPVRQNGEIIFRFPRFFFTAIK